MRRPRSTLARNGRTSASPPGRRRPPPARRRMGSAPAFASDNGHRRAHEGPMAVCEHPREQTPHHRLDQPMHQRSTRTGVLSRHPRTGSGRSHRLHPVCMPPDLKGPRTCSSQNCFPRHSRSDGPPRAPQWADPDRERDSPTVPNPPARRSIRTNPPEGSAPEAPRGARAIGTLVREAGITERCTTTADAGRMIAAFSTLCDLPQQAAKHHAWTGRIAYQ